MKKLVLFFVTLFLSTLLLPGNKPSSPINPSLFSAQTPSDASTPSIQSVPTCQPDALIIFTSSDLAAMQQTIELIQTKGGCAAHVFPPSALIGSLEPEQADLLIANGQLRAVYREILDGPRMDLLDDNTRLAAQVWNEYLRKPQLNEKLGEELPGGPLIGDVREVELPFEPILPAAPNGPGFYDTSEFLYGKVAVGIIIPESNGSIDPSTENWSSSRMDQVVSEIADGMSWYQSTFHEANLTFYYDVHRQVPIGYEPINRPSGDDDLWIHDSFTNLGISGTWTSQAYTYLNQIRTTYQTDWAIVAFVADSLNDTDGKFTDGFFGYTYGFLIVLTYDNDGWGIARMDSVIAHEMAHDFGAADEYCQPGYSCCVGGGSYGYLGISNSNCEAGCDNNGNGRCDGDDSYPNSNCRNCPTCIQTSCIMRSGGVSAGMDSTSRSQIGVRDTDGDGLYDPLDTFPTLTLSAYSPDPSTDNTPSYTGSATDIPYDSPKQADISINYIKSVRFRSDEGAWQFCTATDGAFNQTTEAISCTPGPLSDGVHTLQFQAINRVDQASSIWSDTVTIDATPPANPTNANPGCSAINNVWQNACNDPNFTWSGASDPGSGIAGYYYYWGIDPNGVSTNFTASAAYNPPSVSGSNSYYLRIRTRDNLGNNSAWITLFTFNYDSVPPENPTSLSSPDHSPSTWSNDNTIPFAWSGATDGNGSGAGGYSILWSTSPVSLPDTTVDLTNTVSTSLPLTDGSSWYFHLRTRDQVNLWASSALHSGPFFIDTLPPSSSITQVAVQPCGLSFTLEWTGEDSDSGLASFDLQYRVDSNGVWTDWLQATTLSKSNFGPLSPFGPATETPVYLRVRARDKAGNLKPYPSGDGDTWFVPQSTCLVFMPLTAK